MKKILFFIICIIVSFFAKAQYCSSAATSTSASEVIARVLFGSNIPNGLPSSPWDPATDIINPSTTGYSTTPCSGYGDFTQGNNGTTIGNLNGPNWVSGFGPGDRALVKKGDTYNFFIAGNKCAGWTGGSFNKGLRIWIDWNADNNFDPTEIIYTSIGNQSSWSTTYYGAVTVPMTASLGITRMRVVYQRLTPPFVSAFQIQPCVSYQYGETEDFTIEIAGLINSVSSTNLNCNGINDGTITIVPDVIPPINLVYSIDNGVSWSNNNVFTGLSAGAYNIIVQDTFTGETESYSSNPVIITEPSLLTYSSSITSNYNGADVSCFGATDGEITVNAIGGNPPYSVSYDNGVTFPVNGNSPLTNTGTVLINASTYDIQVMDNNGCTSPVTQLTLNNPPSLSFTQSVLTNYNGFDISCFGSSDGSIEIIASGGTGSYLYSNDGCNNYYNLNTFNSLSAGNYDLCVKDDNGCTLSILSAITLNEPPELLVSSLNVNSNYNGSQISCFGFNDGEISIVVSGGTGPTFNYSIDGGSTYITNGGGSLLVGGLGVGTYDVVVQDINGCTSSLGTNFITLTNPPELNVNGGVTSNYNGSQISCNGGNDGEITLNSIGGTGTLTYTCCGQINSSTNIFSGLSAGTYTVTVQDENNCNDTETITISDPTPVNVIDATITSNYNGSQISCYGYSNGEITILGQGGTSPYSYIDLNGLFSSNSSVVGGLSAGIYNIAIVDDNGCQSVSSVSVNISEPSQVVVSGQVVSNYNGSQISCNGNSDGEISISGLGGTGSYIYSLDNGASFPYSGNPPLIATGLSAGNYSLIVQDQNNCISSSYLVTITEPALINLVMSHLDAGCNGFADGSAWVDVTGGTNPYGYEWSDGQSNMTATSLSAGSYSVLVTDINGCSMSESVIISQPIAQTLSINSTCFGLDDASITASVQNGNANYSYSWDDLTNQQTATATDLSPGVYTVTIVDQFGCILTATDSVIEPEELLISIINTPICYPGDLSTATLVADGGVQPYVFTWNTGEITASINNLLPGNYSIDLNDDNGCNAQFNTNIPAANVMQISFTNTESSCKDNDDAMIYTTIQGGVAPYNFTWSNGTNTQDNLNVISDLYYLEVIDDLGCLLEASTFVDANPQTCLYVYNAFTPNGDITNDFWWIENIDLYPDALVEVYNRWGDRVFSAKNYNNSYDSAWDGTYKGEVLPSATYYYVITLNNEEAPYTGTVNIIR